MVSVDKYGTWQDALSNLLLQAVSSLSTWDDSLDDSLQLTGPVILGLT